MFYDRSRTNCTVHHLKVPSFWYWILSGFFATSYCISMLIRGPVHPLKKAFLRIEMNRINVETKVMGRHAKEPCISHWKQMFKQGVVLIKNFFFHFSKMNPQVPLVVFDFDHTLLDANSDVEIHKLFPGNFILYKRNKIYIEVTLV